MGYVRCSWRIEWGGIDGGSGRGRGTGRRRVLAARDDWWVWMVWMGWATSGRGRVVVCTSIPTYFLHCIYQWKCVFAGNHVCTSRLLDARPPRPGRPAVSAMGGVRPEAAHGAHDARCKADPQRRCSSSHPTNQVVRFNVFLNQETAFLTVMTWPSLWGASCRRCCSTPSAPCSATTAWIGCWRQGTERYFTAAPFGLPASAVYGRSQGSVDRCYGFTRLPQS